jgi:integrase
MPRKAKNSGPYLRGKRGRYYCWIDGHSRSLGTDKPRVAEARYHEKLKAWRQEQERARLGAMTEPTVRECLDFHREHCKRLKATSRAIRERDLAQFQAFAGIDDRPWREATAEVAEAWLDSRPTWGDSTRKMKAVSLHCAFNHCVKRGKIPHSPIRGFSVAPTRRREAVMSDGDEATIYAASRGEFRAILTALRETGARPGELCSARVEDYREGRIVLAEHKTDRHRKERVIYLTASLRAEVEALIGSRTGGPIWRNSRGVAWTPNAILCRFKHLRKKLELGPGCFPYALRHRFASGAINDADANPAMVARLLGHADMTMIFRHYFRENPEAAMRALEEIRKAKGEPPTSPPPASA